MTHTFDHHNKAGVCTECGERPQLYHSNWPRVPSHIFHEIHRLYKLSEQRHRCHVCYCREMGARPLHAGKDYLCLYCSKPITKGSRYIMYFANRPEWWYTYPVRMHVCTDCVPENTLACHITGQSVKQKAYRKPTAGESREVWMRLMDYDVRALRSHTAAFENPQLVAEIIDQAVVDGLRPDQLHKKIMCAMGWCGWTGTEGSPDDPI